MIQFFESGLLFMPLATWVPEILHYEYGIIIRSY